MFAGKVSQLNTGARGFFLCLPNQIPYLGLTFMLKLLNVPGFALEADDGNSWPSRTAIISIGEEWGNQPQLGHLKVPILRVRFSDVEEAFDYKENTLHPMSAGQANEILDFVEEQAPEMLFVHCAAGSSRSGSVVLALHKLYDGKLPKIFWRTASPKPQMVGLLAREFWKRQGEIVEVEASVIGAKIIEELRDEQRRREDESAIPPLTPF